MPYPLLVVFAELSYAESLVRRHHLRDLHPDDLRARLSAEILFTPSTLAYVALHDPDLLRATRIADVSVRFPERLPHPFNSPNDWQVDVHLDGYELNPVITLYRRLDDLVSISPSTGV